MQAFRVAYDGHDYHGFQRQPDVSTVSGAILDALAALDVVAAGGVPPEYAAAGRTDAGVSALGQTVAFEGPNWLSAGALSAELPADIWVWAQATAPADFHPIYDAGTRTYESWAWMGDESVNRDHLTQATERLSGQHDFHNLTPDDEITEREITIEATVEDSLLQCTFRADGFPRQFVRRASALLRAVATGEADMERIGQVLGDDSLSGPAGVAAAPPYGVVLVDVEYPNLEFECDQRLLERARTTFQRRRQELVLRATASRRIADGLL